MSIRPDVNRLALCLAVAAGSLALAGILYDSGFHPHWLERLHWQWLVSSDTVSDYAYQEFLSGKRTEGFALFRTALERDPASPYHWCDYGEALLATGQTEAGHRAVERGLALGPYLAPIHMRALNFAYRTSDSSWALKQGRGLLAITDLYDYTVFLVWSHMELPVGATLDSGLPDRRAAQSYLRFLMEQPAVSDGQQAWSWLLTRNFVDDRLADEYAGWLLRRNEYAASQSAWKSYAGARQPGYPDTNAVFNDSFEWEPSNQTFDWRIVPVTGVQVQRDPSVAKSGKSSLLLQFDGTQNLQSAGVSQQVVVVPGRWTFNASMRTDELTTDEGIRFQIVDPAAPEKLNVVTAPLAGTHDWTDLDADFTAPPATHLVEIRMVRKPSFRFDDKIRGKVWIDSVSLRRAKTH